MGAPSLDNLRMNLEVQVSRSMRFYSPKANAFSLSLVSPKVVCLCFSLRTPALVADCAILVFGGPFSQTAARAMVIQVHMFIHNHEGQPTEPPSQASLLVSSYQPKTWLAGPDRHSLRTGRCPHGVRQWSCGSYRPMNWCCGC